MASSDHDFSSLSLDERRAKLEGLRSQRAGIDQVKELEFELDGLQKKGFALDERLQPLDHLQKQARDAAITVERLSGAGELPEDLPSQKQAHLHAKAVHEGELKELDAEVNKIKEQLERELARTASESGLLQQAFRDPFIAFGAAGGTLALVIGSLGFASFEPLRWVALLDIVGFGVAVFGAFRFIADAEHAARLRGQIKRKEAERARMVDSFELETSAFKALLKRFGLGLEDVDSVEEKIRAYHDAKHAQKAADAAISAALGGASFQELAAEREALSEEIKAMEEKLYEAGGFMGSPAELDAQIKALEVSLAAVPEPGAPVSEVAPTPMATPPQPEAAPDASTPAMPVATAGQTAAHMQKLVEQASDLFVTTLDIACERLAPRAAQYLSGMSDRRYAQMVFGPKGGVSVVDGASGRAIPFGMLTPGDRDIVYLCLKMTIIEQVSSQMRLPVVLAQAFETFPDVKHPLLVRMLQFLAQSTQVVVLTRHQTIAAAGGQPVALPPPS